MKLLLVSKTATMHRCTRVRMAINLNKLYKAYLFWFYIFFYKLHQNLRSLANTVYMVRCVFIC